jgi:hypothetical protein
LTVDELREQVQAGNYREFNKIQRYQENITGSPQYWHARRGDVSALVQDMRHHEGQHVFAFTTGSAAEYHNPALHRLLQRYLLATSRSPSQTVIAEQLLRPDNAVTLRAAIQENGHLVTA